MKNSNKAVDATAGIWARADTDGTPDTYVLYFYQDNQEAVEQLFTLLDPGASFDPWYADDKADGSFVDTLNTVKTDAHVLVHNAKRAGILVSYEVY